MPFPYYVASLRPRPGSVARRFLALGALWWVLTEGNTDGAWLGAVTVAIAVAVSLRAWPPRAGSPSPSAAIDLTRFFLWQSLRSGVAVGRLALRRRLSLRPRLRRLPLRLPGGKGRALLAAMISLLPGTLSVGLEADAIVVHVLDEGLVSEADLQAAHDKVARLYGRP